MKKKNCLKRKIITTGLLISMMLFGGCIHIENNYITNEPEPVEEKVVNEITEEDWKTIEYINANSHLGGIEFMKKLDDGVNVSFDPSYEVGYVENSEEGLVEGMGYLIPELEGKYIARVTINSNDLESDILGVQNGITVEEALDILAEHGFTDYEDNPPYSLVAVKKGRIAVILNYRVGSWKKALAEYTIRHVEVVLN